MKKDYIIVGQGLAGSVLAYQLISNARSVMVIDDGYKSSSSKIAAGMWNPLSFKNLAPTWMANELLPCAEEIYQSMEKTFNVSFYHQVHLARIFPDTPSANNWDERCDFPENKNYATPLQSEWVNEHATNQYGHGVVKESGWLDVPLLLQRSKKWLLECNSFREEKFDFNRLHIEKNKITFEDITAKKIIFCTGVKNNENPFFSHLPLVLNKGEVLTVKMEGLEMGPMLNYGHFLIPLSEGVFRVGSTYELNATHDQPTEERKELLLEKLKEVIGKPAQVLDHLAGFRPTVLDRKPLLGSHPEHSHVNIFNGFGSKGVMLIPYFSNILIDFLEDRSGLDKDIDIKRCYRK